MLKFICLILLISCKDDIKFSEFKIDESENEIHFRLTYKNNFYFRKNIDYASLFFKKNKEWQKVRQWIPVTPKIKKSGYYVEDKYIKPETKIDISNDMHECVKGNNIVVKLNLYSYSLTKTETKISKFLKNILKGEFKIDIDNIYYDSRCKDKFYFVKKFNRLPA
jgi:hypothetical protein